LTQSLRTVGIAAQGCSDPNHATEMFEPNNFELIAFGWGHGRAGCRRA
jgi:hypothetical protein